VVMDTFVDSLSALTSKRRPLQIGGGSRAFGFAGHERLPREQVRVTAHALRCNTGSNRWRIPRAIPSWPFVTCSTSLGSSRHKLSTNS
jgi:hypothetical protein